MATVKTKNQLREVQAKEAEEAQREKAPVLLSRSQILQMGKEELVVIKQKIAEADTSGKEKIKLEIARGTVDELKALREQMPGKEVPVEDIEEEAKKFAEDFMERIVTEEDIDALIEGYRKEQEKLYRRKEMRDQLKGYAGKISGAVVAALGVLGVWQLLSEEEQHAISTATTEEKLNGVVKEVVSKYRDRIPLLPDEMKDVDADDLAVLALFSQSGKTEHEEVKQAEGVASQMPKEGQDFLSKIPGVSFVKENLAKIETLTYFRIFNRASEDLHISKKVLVTVSLMTVGQLRDTVRSFEGEKEEDPKVKELRVLFEKIVERQAELDAEIDRAIEKLNIPGLTEDQKEELQARFGVENLRVVDALNWIYGEKRERENWLTRTLSRIPTMRRAYTYWFGEKKILARANFFGALGARNDFKNWKRDFQQFKEKDLKVVFDEKNQMQMEKLKGKFAELEDSVDKAKPINPQRPEEYSPDHVRQREAIVAKYNQFAHVEWSQIMSKEAENLVRDGKAVEGILGKLEGMTGSTSLSHLQNQLAAPERTFIAKRCGGNVGKIFPVDDLKIELVRGHQERLLSFQTVKQEWMTRISNLQKKCHQRLILPYEQLEEYVQHVGKTDRMLKLQRKVEEATTIPGKARKCTRYFALPAVIVGTEIYQVVKGNVMMAEAGWDLAEAGAGFIPLVGTGLDFKAFITGKSLSGRELTPNEQMASLGFGVIGLVADAGMLFAGAGYGLRAGAAALRVGSKTVKGIENVGKLNSIVFRAGGKIGEALSIFKPEERLRRLAKVGREKEAIDLFRLEKLAKEGKIAAGGADAKRLEELRAMGLQVAESGFLRKGKELWVGAKGKFYKSTLPDDMVRELEGAERLAAQKKLNFDALEKQYGKGLGDLRKEAETYTQAKKKVPGDLEQKIRDLEVLERDHNFYRRRLEGWNAKLETEAFKNAERFKMLDRITRLTSRAGLAMGTLMLVTGGYVTPMNMAETTYEVAKPVVSTVGKVGHSVFFEDHSGPTALDVAIQKMVFENQYKGKVDQLVERGENEAQMLLSHVEENPIAMQAATERGVLQQYLPALRDIAKSDTGRKVAETLRS